MFYFVRRVSTKNRIQTNRQARNVCGKRQKKRYCSSVIHNVTWEAVVWKSEPNTSTHLAGFQSKRCWIALKLDDAALFKQRELRCRKQENTQRKMRPRESNIIDVPHVGKRRTFRRHMNDLWCQNFFLCSSAGQDKLWKSFSFTFRNRTNKIKNTKLHRSDNPEIVFSRSAFVSGNKPGGVMRSWRALISLPHSKPHFAPVCLQRFFFSRFERSDDGNWRQTVGGTKTFQTAR